MSKFLVVAHWDSNNYITGSNHSATKDKADELVAVMVSEGNSGAFHVSYPDSGDVSTWVVNGSAKTVTDGTKNPAVVQEEWVVVRAERDRLLASSDWTQYNDSPLTNENKASWAKHRQELRDLPAVTTDPADPTWPEAPE